MPLPTPLAPPRLIEAVFRWMLRDEPWRETTLGDLREEFAVVTHQRGRQRAQVWYWRELFTLITDRQRRIWHHRFTKTAVRKDSSMRTLVSEIRFAARALRRQPLVSLVVIVTLALGLGANAATFGMIDALLLRPFTIPNVDQLVVLSEVSAENPFLQQSVSAGNYADLRAERPDAITRMSTVSWWNVNLSGTDQPERIQGSQVGAQFFQMLGIAPAAGRFFVPDDEVVGASRSVVISDSLWKSRFGGQMDFIGQTVRLDGEPYTVIGRAPADFGFPNGSDVWTPFILTDKEVANRASKYLTVIGELAPGADVARAQAQLTTSYQRLKDLDPAANRAYTLTVSPFTRAMVDEGMPQVLMLWQAAALLLLVIAGTNIASLLLARGAERQRELALRLAIGAGRWRIVRQMLVESVVLAAAAVPAALMVAAAAMGALRSLLPAELVRYLPGWSNMVITPRVALMTVAAAVGSAVIFGLLPALQSSKPALSATLKDGGRSVTAGAGKSRLRRGLVVAEIAVALPLLVASGLAAVAGHRLANGAQGYEPDGVVKLLLSLPEATHPKDDDRRQFVGRLLDEVALTPGVTQAATTTTAPASSSNSRRPLVVDGRPEDPMGPRGINYRAVSPQFFETLQIPVQEGRPISAQDRENTELVAVVSQSLAALYWPEQSPIGRRVKLRGTDKQWITVVGISGNVLDDWFSSRNAPTIYVPERQWPSTEVHLLAKGNGSSEELLTALRATLARVDSSVPAFSTGTMRQAIALRTTGLRFIGQLMAAFGILALLLSAAGIYSVMAHYVAQRRHEIGVRMALGATTRDVLRLTIGSGLKLAGFGVAGGLILGVALARVIESALFGVVALEPMLFVATTGVLTLVALLATLLPARHALTVDPAGALRD